MLRPKKAEPARGLGRLLEPGRWGRGGWGLDRVFSLKRVAIFQIRFLALYLFVFTHVVIAKPLHTFARHA
ncbi:hypothetical protein D3Y55_13220 [Mesorhizobium sp. DCY119]|nr:hypothetical protein D3Y55_13220 [Mesorhizobium sp. DCY119]